MGKITITKATEKKTGKKSGLIAEEIVLEEETSGEAPHILHEVNSMREENVKHFRLSNGTFMAAVYDEPVHYFDKQEKCFKEYGSGFKEENTGYIVHKGDIDVELLKNGAGTRYLRIKKGKKEVSWGYQPHIGKKTAKATVQKRDKDKNKLYVQTDSVLKYTGMDRDVDMEYHVTPRGVKENIIIKKPAEEYVYRFPIRCDGLKIRLNEWERQVELYDSENESGEPEFYIPAPFMTDKLGERSDEVFYRLTEQGDGYLLEIEASAEWINAEERKFPITIDPLIIATKDSVIHSKTLTNGSGLSNFNIYRYVGYESLNVDYMTYFRVKMPNIPQASNIISAEMELVQRGKSYCDCGTMGFEVRQAKTTLDPYNATSASQITYDNTVLDFLPQPKQNQTSSIYEANETQTHHIDLTKLMSERFPNMRNSQYLYFVLKSADGEYQRDCNYIEFWSEKSNGNGPKLYVYYATKNVFGDNQAYEAIDMGKSGNGQVNLFTGRLTYTFTDVSVPSERMPLEIMHVYNSYMGDAEEGKFNNVYGSYRVGKHWKLGFQQYMEKITPPSDYEIAGGKNEDKELYLYVDGMGAEHYFTGKSYYYYRGGKIYIGADDIMLNEDGSECTKQPCGCFPVYHELSDDGGQNWTYNAKERILEDSQKNKVYFDANGRVIKIKDAYDNFITIAYYADSIKVTDNNGRSAALKFYNNRLTHITAPDGTVRQYDYTAGDLLRRIKHPNSMSTWFDYTGNRLTRIIEEDTVESCLTYDSSDKISEILQRSQLKEVGYDTVVSTGEYEELSRTEITYRQYRATEVKRNQSDTAVYVFDADGCVITQYKKSKDSTGYGNVKDGIVYQYSHFRRSFEAETNGLGNNFVTNGSFETVGNWYTTNSDVSDGRVQTDAAQGRYAYKLIGNPRRIKRIYQYIDLNKLPGNAYNLILSGWAKANSLVYDPNSKYSEIKKRRFELRLEIQYNEGGNQNYSAYFDWNCMAWQFAAVPIPLDPNKTLRSLTVYADYSYNANEVLFDNIRLTQGTGTFSAFTENGLLISQRDGYYILTNELAEEKTSYHQIGDVMSSTLTDRYDETKKYVTEYRYDAYHNVIWQKDYRGVITEYLRNGYGTVTKTYTYYDKTKRIVQESKLDAGGNYITEVYDERGTDIASKFTYQNSTGLLLNSTTPQSQQTDYAYNTSQDITKMSATVGGKVNANDYVYKKGYPVRITHNGVNFDFTYNAKGLTEIKVAGTKTTNLYHEKLTDYLTTGRTCTVASYVVKNGAYTLRTVYDRNGQAIAVQEYQSGDALSAHVTDTPDSAAWKKIVTNTYDDDGYLTQSVDELNRVTYRYEYDAYGDMKQCTYSTNGRNVTLSASYGDKFHRLDKQVQKIDSVERAYEYTYEDGPDARLKTVALPTGYKTYPKYDNLGRSAGRIMRIKTGDLIFEETIAYLTGSESTSPKYTRETNYVTSIKHYSRLGSVTETTGYGYDKNGNIETVTLNGVQKKKYTYDGLNRLTKEVNTPFGTTTEYEYDAGGNITQKRVSGQAAIGYGYDTANKDRLISYNGETIGEYDAQGNPWKYRGKTLSWAKRGELTQFGSSYYAYNANGVRTSKNGIKYFYNGQNLIKEEHTDYSLWFFYDERGIAGFTKSGNANSVTSSDTSYYYRKNAEGDITHLYSQGGDLLARYEYNAWGEVRVYNRNGSDITEGSNYANEIGRINPIRYRGYYYDEDTKLYYLINRYYDPEVGRFINADDIKYLDPETLGGINLFAYCNNNPVMYVDPMGTSWLLAFAIVALFLFTPVGGVAAQVVATTTSYVGLAVASIWDEEIREDMNRISWNPFNSNAKAVFGSNKISFYKGMPVFLKDSGRSGSFFVISLNRYRDEDELRHERGHGWQAMMMGIGTFGITVAIPSPLALGPWAANNKYYSAPWETLPDILGGVQGRTHTAEEIKLAWGYYAVSMIFPPAAYFFLIQ